MSKRKAFLPESYVLGASPVLDFNDKLGKVVAVTARETMRNKGHGDVPYVRAGDPMWRKPKPTALVMHFKNAAVHRECTMRAAKQFGIPAGAVTRAQALSVTTPKEVRIVPMYRGVSGRLANQIMAAKRRDKRLEEERRANMTLLQRTLEAVGFGEKDASNDRLDLATG